MSFTLSWLIEAVANTFIWAILIRTVISWVRPTGYAPAFNQIEDFLVRITEPILAPIRRMLPTSWGIDFSPWLAIVLIGFVRQILLGGLFGF